MRKQISVLNGLLVTGFVLLVAGCAPPPPPPASTAPTVAAKPSPPASNTASEPDPTAVREAVETVLSKHAHLFPKGTALESVTVQDHVATLDFNAAFSGLSNMGDSVESGAQKQLRAALAKFPEIEKMRVTVGGKPFDSQATDWDTPFPVRMTEGEKEASDTGSQTAVSAGPPGGGAKGGGSSGGAGSFGKTSGSFGGGHKPPGRFTEPSRENGKGGAE